MTSCENLGGVRLYRALWIVSVLALGCGSDSGDKAAMTHEPSQNGDAGDDAGALSCVTDLEKVNLAPTAPPKYKCDANKSSVYPDGGNACRNTNDCDLIATDQIRRLAKECAIGCRGATDCDMAQTCNHNCLNSATKNQLDGTLSDGCGLCYAHVALCAFEHCYAQCADDPDSLDCVECSFKEGCRVPFEKCSGLDREN
jgi:hypothetical protein